VKKIVQKTKIYKNNAVDFSQNKKRGYHNPLFLL